MPENKQQRPILIAGFSGVLSPRRAQAVPKCHRPDVPCCRSAIAESRGSARDACSMYATIAMRLEAPVPKRTFKSSIQPATGDAKPGLLEQFQLSRQLRSFRSFAMTQSMIGSETL